MDKKPSVPGSKISKMNKISSEIDLEDIFRENISDEVTDHKDVKFHRRMSRDVFADSSDAGGLFRVDELGDLPSFPFPNQVCVSALCY